MAVCHKPGAVVRACKHQVPLSEHCDMCSPGTVVTYGTCAHGVHMGAGETCDICRPSGGSSSYYDLPRDSDTLQDVIVNRNMSWNQANIFKAAYRWDIKPDKEYNLRKIIWFAQDELDRYYSEIHPRNHNGHRPSGGKTDP